MASAYGLRVGLRASSSDALSALRDLLPGAATPSEKPLVDIVYSAVAGHSSPGERLRRYSLAFADGARIARSMDFEDVLQAVDRHLELYLAEFARTHVFIHAGVIAWGNRAIVIPGRTQAGKSTLVAAFVRAGATYYSDEFATLDRLGRIHAYPRSIKLRDGGNLLPETLESEYPQGRPPVRAGLMLITRYRQDTAWRPRRVSAATGLMAALVNTVSARRNPERAISSLKRMMDGVSVLKSGRGEAETVVDNLLRSGLFPV